MVARVCRSPAFTFLGFSFVEFDTETVCISLCLTSIRIYSPSRNVGCYGWYRPYSLWTT